jgi:hypothetical protein
MHCVRRSLLLVLLCFFASSLQAAEGKIFKVLPHFLDKKGRHTLYPSLYERDAYQAFLRRNSEERTAIRFDIDWKAKRPSGQLKLRLQARGISGSTVRDEVLESSVDRTGWFSRWTPLTLTGDAFAKFGDLVAWRATLWDGEHLIAEQKSFLWE